MNDRDLLLELVLTPPPTIGLPKVDESPVFFELVSDTEYDTVSIVDCELGIKVEDVH